MSFLLGIDSGLTVTKAVLYDAKGTVLGLGRANVAQHKPKPHWVERDVHELLRATSQAIIQALGTHDPHLVRAIGVTGHGDGLYLLDDQLQPTRPAILSLDSRGQSAIDQWRADGSLAQIFKVTGQVPFPSTPAALLAWLKAHEPATLARSRWALSCKDTIKAWLTGEVCTDVTEASVSFTDVHSQRYSSEAFAAYGLEWVQNLVGVVVDSCEIAGSVRTEAAAQTGLAVGTPVIAGMHDVDACAVASGSLNVGDLALVAGSYSINEVISDRAHPSELWNVRNFVQPGMYLNMATSPASATNLEWYVANLATAQMLESSKAEESPFATLLREVEALPVGEDDPLYLPFLYGSPIGPHVSAAVLGLRGWHTGLHTARAVLEGVAFTHRWHVDDLATTFAISATTLTGGATHSRYWSQMFANALGRSIDIKHIPESGTLGVAMAAGVAAGEFASLAEAGIATTPAAIRLEPQPAERDRFQLRYQRFRQATAATLRLAQEWDSGATAP
ncbi:MAG: FGGY-family carbohydrate kinase [Beutenbergiaceae bacterium]